MSISSALVAAQGRVADCYTAVANKGGTIPNTQNLANLPTAINSIPSGSSATTPRFLKCTLTSSDFEVDDYGDLDPSEVDDFVSTLVINVILDLETTDYGRILWLPDLQSIEELPGDLSTVFENKCYCNGYSDNVDTSKVLVGYKNGLDSYFTLYMTVDGVYFFKNNSVPYLAEDNSLFISSEDLIDQDGYNSQFTVRLTANKFFTPAT